MSDHFISSYKKIQWAEKHIRDLQSLLAKFTRSDFYTVSVKAHPKQGTNFLCFKIRHFRFPVDDAALTIGDALHNLRSALDLMYYETVLACNGVPTAWTRFPICKTGKELTKRWAKSALKQKQVSCPVIGLVLDTIKPYEAGNPLLWALHALNIVDKHQLLIPMLKFMGFTGVRLEDDKGQRIGRSEYLMNKSCTIRLMDANDRKVTVKDKGHASMAILFDEGTPLQGESIVPTLKRIAEVVTRTVEAFELLFP